MNRAKLLAEIVDWSRSHLNSNDYASLLRIAGYYAVDHDLEVRMVIEPKSHRCKSCGVEPGYEHATWCQP